MVYIFQGSMLLSTNCFLEVFVFMSLCCLEDKYCFYEDNAVAIRFRPGVDAVALRFMLLS